MPKLTRRRYSEMKEECWHIYYGDVHVGVIGIRAGIPWDEDPWGWSCGFYPGSHPGECSNGAAPTRRGFVRLDGPTRNESVRAGFESRFRSVEFPVMRKSNWTPSIVPRGDDQDVYLVMDDFGRLGRVWREADVEETDLETVVTDLLDGQYENPIGIFAFNAVEGWSRDVSEDVAQELRRRCDLEGQPPPASVVDFVERHEGGGRQLTLRLV